MKYEEAEKRATEISNLLKEIQKKRKDLDTANYYLSLGNFDLQRQKDFIFPDFIPPGAARSLLTESKGQHEADIAELQSQLVAKFIN